MGSIVGHGPFAHRILDILVDTAQHDRVWDEGAIGVSLSGWAVSKCLPERCIWIRSFKRGLAWGQERCAPHVGPTELQGLCFGGTVLAMLEDWVTVLPGQRAWARTGEHVVDGFGQLVDPGAKEWQCLDDSAILVEDDLRQKERAMR